MATTTANVCKEAETEAGYMTQLYRLHAADCSAEDITRFLAHLSDLLVATQRQDISMNEHRANWTKLIAGGLVYIDLIERSNNIGKTAGALPQAVPVEVFKEQLHANR